LTEEEARRHACCSAMVVEAISGGDLRLKAAPCIASECMVWRWDLEPNGRTERRPGGEVRVEIPGDGHCGLAGQP
jgi:hypothetical protein